MTHSPPVESVLTQHLVAWAAWTGEKHKMQAQPRLHLCGVPEHLNLSDLDLGSTRNPGPAPWKTTWSLSSVDWKAHTLWMEANTVWPRHCEWYLFAVFLPPHSTTEQVSLNKRPPVPPCVRAESRHWRHLQNRRSQINREPLWKWQVQQIKIPVVNTDYIGKAL